MSEGLWIPPQGMQFRLIAYYSAKAVCGKDGVVNHSDASNMNDDMWWTLVPHSYPGMPGVYHIQSGYKYNDEKCITIKSGSGELYLSPINDTNDGDGPMQWFKLKPGAGRYKGCFVIYQSRHFLNSPLADKPLIAAYQGYNHTGLAEEYFSFAFEDTEAYKIDFNLDHAKLTGDSKTRVFEQKVSNGGTRDASMTLDLRKATTGTGTFNHNHGFKIEAKSKLKVKSVPIIGPEGEFELNGSTEHNWAWGESNSWTETIGFVVSTVVPPKHIGVGKGVFKESEISVPVKIYSRSKANGVDAITEALYTGVCAWGFTYNIDHLPLEAKNS